MGIVSEERIASVRNELENKIDATTLLTMYKGVPLTELDAIHLMVIVQNEYKRFAAEAMT